MKDWLFYPLALCVFAGIVVFALSFGEDVPNLTEAEILAQGYSVQGERLYTLTASPGTTLEMRPTTIVIKSHLTRESAPPSAGVFATLGSNFESAFAGKDLDISVRGRVIGSADRATLEIGYFTVGEGDSGWKAFEITPDYAEYGFSFSPQPKSGPAAQDYVGIWPDPLGENTAIEIEAIKISVR